MTVIRRYLPFLAMIVLIALALELIPTASAKPAKHPAPAGSAPAGSAPAGSAPAGSAPAGSAPSAGFSTSVLKRYSGQFLLIWDQGIPLSTSGSRGSPSMRSAIWLRSTSEVPPSMVLALARRKV